MALVTYDNKPGLLPRFLVTALWICDSRTGQELCRLAMPLQYLVGPVFHPNGQILTASPSEPLLRFWDGAAGQLKRTGRLGQGSVNNLELSSDGRQLAGVLRGRSPESDTVKVWDTETLREIATLRGHAGWVNCLAFGPDGRRLATGGPDKAVIIWDLMSRREALAFRGHTDGILGLAFSPSGDRLVSSSNDETIRIWDASPLKEAIDQNEAGSAD